MTKISRSFIIRFYNDEHGMRGTFESIQAAVDRINEYYKDLSPICRKGGKWIIVCEDRTRITNGGEFLREEIHRYTVAKVRYSDHAEAFVSEGVQLQNVVD